MAVAVLLELVGLLKKLLLGEPALVEANFFEAGDLVALALFNGFNELRGFQKTFVGASVEPGEAPAQLFYVQLTLFQVGTINAGNFQFAPVAGFYLFGDLDHTVVVEIEAGYGVVGFGMFWLFFDRDSALVFIELHHPEAFWIFYLIAEYGGAFSTLCGLFQLWSETLAVEDVVAQHQAHTVVTDEFFADDKGLSKPIRARLYGVAEVDAKLFAVTQGTPEACQIFRGGDDEDVPDARKHEYRERVIDHGFVVHRQQLFGGAQCYGVQAGAGTACEDYAFHLKLPKKRCFATEYTESTEGHGKKIKEMFLLPCFSVDSVANKSVVRTQALSLVAAVLYALAPVEIVEVPLDGFADAGFEGFFWCPAEFFLDFAGVYGVAHVVARAVFYICDQIPVTSLLWAEFLEDVADGVDHFDVLFFVVATDVVGFAGLAFFDHFVEGASVVFYKQPITDLVAFAVYREWLAFQGIEDHQRHELFGEMIRTVVVGAVCDQHRQAVGALPGSYQVV